MTEGKTKALNHITLLINRGCQHGFVGSHEEGALRGYVEGLSGSLILDDQCRKDAIEYAANVYSTSDGGYIFDNSIFSDSKAVLAVQVAERMWDYMQKYNSLIAPAPQEDGTL